MLSIKETSVDKALRKGEPSFLPQPLIVTRSVVRCPLMEQVGWEWKIISHPDGKKGHVLDVDRETALKVANLCGLKPVHETKNGTVYDTPNGAFRRLYQGCEVGVA